MNKDSINGIKDGFDKSKKISEFLELHVSQRSRRSYRYHLFEYAKFIQILNYDTYLKDPRKLSNNKRIEYEDKINKDILSYWKYINEISEKFHGKTAYVFLSALKLGCE